MTCNFSAKDNTDTCDLSGAMFQCIGRELQKVSCPVIIILIMISIMIFCDPFFNLIRLSTYKYVRKQYINPLFV